MAAEIVGQNFVVTAHNFNLTIVTQLWLVKNSIVREDEFSGSSIFTPAFAQVVTKSWTLQVHPERIHAAPINSSDDGYLGAAKALGRLIKKLPETPYSAVGINFGFSIRITNIGGVSRRLFLPEKSPLQKAFTAEDARFGGYFSKPALGFILNVDAKPIKEDGKEVLHCSFNFHRDIGRERAADDIVTSLKKASQARKLAESLALDISEGVDK